MINTDDGYIPFNIDQKGIVMITRIAEVYDMLKGSEEYIILASQTQPNRKFKIIELK